MVMALSVRNRMPPLVLTTAPLAMLLDEVGSRLSKRTAPVAAVSSTRSPVASKVSPASTSRGTVRAGTMPASMSGVSTSGRAATLNDSGPTEVWRGMSVTSAEGRSRNAPTPPTTATRAMTRAATRNGVRGSRRPPDPDAARERAVVAGRTRGSSARPRPAAAVPAPGAWVVRVVAPLAVVRAAVASRSASGAGATAGARRRGAGTGSSGGRQDGGSRGGRRRADQGRPGRRPAVVIERRLVLLDAGEDGDAGRRGQGPGRGVAGHDRQALLVGQRVASQQPEVDARGGHP